jgi:zinc protease
LSREQLAAFDRAYYHPNNSILVIVGDIDEGALKGRIIPALQRWPQKPVPGQRPEPVPKEHTQTVNIDRPVTQSNIIVGNRGMSRDNPDYYAALVMNYILGGGGLSSRLMQEIRNKKGLVYSVESFFGAQKRSGSFQVVLQTKSASTDEAIRAVTSEIARIRTEPVSSQELDDAKKYLVGSFPQRFSSQSKIAAFFGQVEYYGLGLDYPERYSGLIDAVTGEDVLRVARTYLHPDAFVTVVVADLKAAGINAKGSGAP